MNNRLSENLFLRCFLISILIIATLLPNISFAGGGGGARGKIGLKGTDGFISGRTKELQFKLKMEQIKSEEQKQVENIIYELQVEIATATIKTMITLAKFAAGEPPTNWIEAMKTVAPFALKSYLETALKRTLSKEEVDAIKLSILSINPAFVPSPLREQLMMTQFEIAVDKAIEIAVREALK